MLTSSLWCCSTDEDNWWGLGKLLVSHSNILLIGDELFQISVHVLFHSDYALFVYHNESNYSNHSIIQTPPFSRKNY